MRIAILCGPADYPWSPDSAQTGVGGSEEAVIYLSAALVRAGQQVTVYNSKDWPTRYFEGVVYKSYRNFDPDDAMEIGVVWRYARLRRYLRPSGGRLYLWLHDAYDETRFLNHADSYDRIMVLSQFHRSLYPHIDRQKFFVTRNGIVPEHFHQSVVRDCQKIVFGSSYDRGLQYLLQAWPKIKKAVPLASLSVFYGWQSMERARPERCMIVRKDLEQLMASEGITHLGRISHIQVAREYLSAGVWAYPASFPEVSCISAMKAQAGGAIPVVIPSGALRETVRFGFKTSKSFTDYPWQKFPRRFIDEWVEAVISYIRNSDKQQAVRDRMVPQFREFYSWDRVATDWIREFGAAEP